MKRCSTLLLSLVFLAPAQAKPAEPLETVLPRFEKLASELFSQSAVPGMSVAIVYNGQPVFVRGYGVRQAGGASTVDETTVFQLASCSKPMTSTAVAILADQGKLTFDDPMQQRLPELSFADPWVDQHATLRDLLSHRSGLPEFAGDILEDLGFDRIAIFERLRYLPRAYDFRAGYAYSNFGFTAAGEVAARATGLPYDQMMDRTLFEPAQMSSSSARFSDYESSPRRAYSHQIVDGKALRTVRRPDAQAPAGGVSSTAEDMTRFMLLHLGQGKLDGTTLVSEPTLAQTYRIHASTESNPATFSTGGYYGLGWGVANDDKGRLRLSHSGAFELGVRSCVTLLPDEGVGIAVMCNAFPSGLPEALSMSFLKMYDGESVDTATAKAFDHQIVATLEGMFSSPGQNAKTSARTTPALPLASYAGTYHSDYFGETQITAPGDSLTLKLGNQTFLLRHRDRDAFQVVPPSQTYEDLGPFELNFSMDSQGKVTGFRQAGLVNGPAWFSKVVR